MSNNSANSNGSTYDVLPYPPYTFPVTHIGRLGAIGRLFGLETKEPEHARVLELGCGSGANLVAMGQIFPSAEFVGIDSAKKQIEMGEEMSRSAGTSNVRLIGADFSKLDEDLGKFDYIITHGIYSWVPAPVKQAILTISSRNLNPGGVAYVSYNCLPGWRMRSALRDMMMMHTDGISDLLQKVAQAKALIRFLAESCAEETAYGKYLRQELDLLSKVDDSYIAHEFLETENEALYFKDFLKAAAEHQLVYLGDAEPSSMIADNLPAKAAETLKSLKLNLLATEQYMDFVRNRTFRSTLLCHPQARIVRSLDPSRMAGLHVLSQISVKRRWEAGSPAVFAGAGGTELTVAEQITAEVLTKVSEMGYRSQPLETLLDSVVAALPERLGGLDPAAVRADLSRILLQGYLRKMVDFTLGAPSNRKPVGEHPETLPLARWQAGRGYRVSSFRLDMMNADPFIGKFITLCDGTRDRAGIIEGLKEAMLKGEFQLNENGQPIDNPERAQVVVEAIYDGSLQNLGRIGLLV